MNEACEKVIRFWTIAAKSGRGDDPSMPFAVYAAATNRPPPPDLGAMNTAVALCQFVHREETGRALDSEEVRELVAYAVHLNQSAPNADVGVAKFLSVLPWLIISVAIAAVTIGPFSWVVLGAAGAMKWWDGYARWLAARGDPSASFHIKGTLLMMLLSVGTSVASLAGIVKLP